MDALRNFFSQLLPLDDASWKIISSSFRLQKLKKGDFLAEIGKTCPHLAFVNAGMLRHYYVVEGNEVTRWIAFENNFTTAAISFFRQVPSSENIVALESSSVWTVSFERWQDLLKETPGMPGALALVMQENYLGMEERLYEMIALPAEERYAKWLQRFPLYAERVPLHYIASLLGISPQHLSRIRAKKK